MPEYTGQLIGGPEHGNFVTASVERIKYQLKSHMWLDGENAQPSGQHEIGWYEWDPERRTFFWTVI